MRLALRFSLFLVFCLPSAHAADWVEYTSENFTLYSDTSHLDTLAMLQEFEVFRLAAMSVLGLAAEPESERLVIVMFSRSRDYGKLAPANSGGFFYHSIFGPRMIVGPSQREFRRSVLFHEYVHYLMNRHFDINYPRWYSEGMATVLETTEIYADRIKIGALPIGYNAYIGQSVWNSMHDLIDLEYDGMSGEFYMHAWLLVHYLMLDVEDDGTRKRQTFDYLSRFDAGEDPVEAFEHSFGISPDSMQARLRVYLRGTGIGGLEAGGVAYSGGISERELDEGEAMYLLGDLAVELDRYDAAYDYFDDMESAASTVADVRKAATRRAIALIHEEEVAQAQALIDEVIATNPQDPDLLADIAHFAFDHYTYDKENADEINAEVLQQAIEFGERAVAAAPGDLEALYYLGLSYELNGDLQSAVDTLLRSYDINPSVPRLNSNLARILIKGQQPELATFLLRRLFSATHSEEARAAYAEIIDEIADGEYDVESISAQL